MHWKSRECIIHSLSWQHGWPLHEFNESLGQEKIQCTSHNALLPMGYCVVEVMWGNSDQTYRNLTKLIPILHFNPFSSLSPLMTTYSYKISHWKQCIVGSTPYLVLSGTVQQMYDWKCHRLIYTSIVLDNDSCFKQIMIKYLD